MSSKNSKIKSLQALRALAFIGIFLVHSKVTWGWSRLGVSIFFCLSGFLMTYIYWDRQLPEGLVGAFKFSIGKIKKLYPLHIITMLVAVFLEIKLYRLFGTLRESIGILIRDIFLNVFLVQTWYPDSHVNVALNGVAWYLSVAMFLYFLFPFILRWMRKRKLATLVILAIALIALQIITAYPMVVKYGEADMTYRWFVYTFPVYRIGDFVSGCVLGRVYLETLRKKTGSGDIVSNVGKENNSSEIGSVITYTIIEAALLAFTIWFSLWLGTPTEDPILLALRNWASGYILMALMWIWVFVQCKGLLTKVISNPLLIALGDISPQAFLLHYCVIRIVNAYMGLHGIYFSSDLIWRFFAGEFVVTVILCVAYNKLSEMIGNKIRPMLNSK